MSMTRSIPEATRRDLFRAIQAGEFNWIGRLGPVGFLSRLYDLHALPSSDSYFEDAAQDIAHHTDKHPDNRDNAWPPFWVLWDPRFELLSGSDQRLLDFLLLTIHPMVRAQEADARQWCEIFNDHLRYAGWELVVSGWAAGRPVFTAQRHPIAGPEVADPTDAASAHAAVEPGTAESVGPATRLDIFEAITDDDFRWAGALSDQDFLSRLYDLHALPSSDSYFEDAAQDIAHHTDKHPDNRDNAWPPFWVLGDPRFGLVQGDGRAFLAFICLTLHPIVRTQGGEAVRWSDIFNSHLRHAGWQLVVTSGSAGRPVFSARRLAPRDAARPRAAASSPPPVAKPPVADRMPAAPPQPISDVTKRAIVPLTAAVDALKAPERPAPAVAATPPITPPPAAADLAAFARFLWDEGDSGVWRFGDSNLGHVGGVTVGTAGHALIAVLSQEDFAGIERDLAAVAREVDMVTATARARPTQPPRRDAADEDSEGDEPAGASAADDIGAGFGGLGVDSAQLRRSRPGRPAPIYSGLDPGKLYELFRSLIRSVSTGPAAKKWRDRWFHWDEARGTVRFGLDR